MAALVSNWGGERLSQAKAIMMLGSKWWPGPSKALATAAGASVVLAGGEVTHTGSPVAKLGR